MKNLSLARQLGAEIIHQVGDDLAQVIIDVANKENVTQIIVGKSVETNWQRWLGIPTMADRLVNLSGQIDVHMVRISSPEKNFPRKPKDFLSRIKPREYGLSFLIVCLCHHCEFIFRTFDRLSNTGPDVFTDRCFKRSYA